jgi:hypothetical protein
MYRPPTGALDGRGQQAPGFWAQKSSNCCASEPSGGGWSLLAESWPVSGAVVPPALSVVDVPVLPVVAGLPVEPVPESGVGVGVAVSFEVLVSLLEELLSLDEAASAGDVSDCGTVTSAGGPGTSVAVVSLPPQPAATRASRPAATSAMMRPRM